MSPFLRGIRSRFGSTIRPASFGKKRTNDNIIMQQNFLCRKIFAARSYSSTISINENIITATYPISNSPFVLRHNDSENGIATLTLNRPDQLNLLSMDMLKALKYNLDEVHLDRGCRVVILDAKGKAYCAGHDLAEIQSNNSEIFNHELFTSCSSVMLQIRKLRQPVIAQVHGAAAAAGCQLVAACDIVVADIDHAKFAVPGINLGLFCSTPAVQLSRSINNKKKAFEMLCTGQLISANMAYEYGLVNQVVPSSELKNATMSIAKMIASKSPFAISRGKQMFYQQYDMTDISEASAFATQCIVSDLNSLDAKEGIDAFLNKRKPNWKGT